MSHLPFHQRNQPATHKGEDKVNQCGNRQAFQAVVGLGDHALGAVHQVGNADVLAQAIQKGNNLAHHLIQSFAPGEATPEQAHEIGKQLADEVLQGKYPYVLTTHIDNGHLHNHIIFCAVDMVQQRKYISNRRSYAYIRRTSDRLCKENGLSVVKPGKDKGKSYAEWDAQRKGKSWKAKLKIAIDAAIPQAKDFDDFLRLMQAQGYEIKHGKFVSFRAPGQERFTRCKTLGENYTEEAITSRIKGLAVDRGPNRQRKGITLRIDLENNIKAQQSAGYARWAKLENLKQAAKTISFLTEHGIEQYAELESKVAEISAANDEAAAALKDVERRLGNMAVLIKNLTTYKQLRPVVLEYRKAKDKAAFRRQHESQLILYEAAAKALKEAGITKLSIGIQSFQEKFQKLLGRTGADMDSLKAALSQVPFETVSMDFIFALPSQTFGDLKADVDAAFEAGANHVALYPFIDFTFTDSVLPSMGKKEKRRLLDQPPDFSLFRC